MTIHIGLARRASVLGGCVLAAATAIAVAGSAAAQSDDAGAALTAKVRYADLNLTSEAGAKTMLGRIEYAARRVCGSPDVRDLAQVAAYDHCKAETVVRTVRVLGAPLVAAAAGQPSAAVALNGK
jgi:UrcA family protein